MDENWDTPVFAILHEGVIIGYTASIIYLIDDPLFDGGGTTLYFNTLGELVVEVDIT